MKQDEEETYPNTLSHQIRVCDYLIIAFSDLLFTFSFTFVFKYLIFIILCKQAFCFLLLNLSPERQLVYSDSMIPVCCLPVPSQYQISFQFIFGLFAE